MASHEVRRWIKLAEARGWTVTQTGKSHWRFVSPDPATPPIYVPGTSCSQCGSRNAVARFRRAGLPV